MSWVGLGRADVLAGVTFPSPPSEPVDDHVVVDGVVGDVTDHLRVQPQVQRVQHRAHGRDGRQVLDFGSSASSYASIWPSERSPSATIIRRGVGAISLMRCLMSLPRDGSNERSVWPGDGACH